MEASEKYMFTCDKLIVITRRNLKTQHVGLVERCGTVCDMFILTASLLPPPGSASELAAITKIILERILKDKKNNTPARKDTLR